MNECFLFLHVIIVVIFGLIAFRMGKTTLVSWIALQTILANLFVIKQVCLFNLHVTCSDVFAIGSIFGINLLREYYGEKISQKTLWTCCFISFFFVVMAQIHLLYHPSIYDQTQDAFKIVLSSSPRLLFVSLATFFICQQLDLYLFGYLKSKLHRIPLSIRNAFSISITQFIDTFIFTFFGLWGLVNHLGDIILMTFLIKLIVIGLMSPLILFSKRFVPQEIS